MNWLDIVIIVVIGASVFGGLKIGLIKAALSLAGIIVGVVLAGRFYGPLSEALSFIPQTGAAQIVAFAIILIGVMAIAAVLAAVLKWTASKILLGWVNHLGGAILGLLFGAIICSALLAIGAKYFGANTFINESALATLLLDRLPMVLALLPSEFDSVRSFFQ